MTCKSGVNLKPIKYSNIHFVYKIFWGVLDAQCMIEAVEEDDLLDFAPLFNTPKSSQKPLCSRNAVIDSGTTENSVW